MVYKVFGALIIGAAVALVFLTFQDDLGLGAKTKVEACMQLTPAQQFNKLINEDFQQLLVSGKLPAAWNNIATVEIRMNSELAKALLGKSRPQIQRVKEGTSYLELEIVDLPDEENPGVIIQASLFDIKSKNKIFEIGRTYTMSDLNNPISAEEKNAAAKNEARGDIAPTGTPGPGSSVEPTAAAEPTFDKPLVPPASTPAEASAPTAPAPSASPTATAVPVEPGSPTVPSVNASGATPTPNAAPSATSGSNASAPGSAKTAPSPTPKVPKK